MNASNRGFHASPSAATVSTSNRWQMLSHSLRRSRSQGDWVIMLAASSHSAAVISAGEVACSRKLSRVCPVAERVLASQRLPGRRFPAERDKYMVMRSTVEVSAQAGRPSSCSYRRMAQ